MAQGSGQRGPRNKRKYSGGQTNERKEQIMKKLRALKDRKENTRHSIGLIHNRGYKLKYITILFFFIFMQVIF